MTQSLIDSIATSVSMGLFDDEESAVARHVLHTQQTSLPIRLFKEGRIENFNPARLSETPYPPENRPRGKRNLLSVNFHRQTVRNKGRVDSPIWVARKGSQMIMLDGVHRVVATYLEGKRKVPAFVVHAQTRRRQKRA